MTIYLFISIHSTLESYVPYSRVIIHSGRQIEARVSNVVELAVTSAVALVALKCETDSFRHFKRQELEYFVYVGIEKLIVIKTARSIFL
jgi:hypothetical protein